MSWQSSLWQRAVHGGRTAACMDVNGSWIGREGVCGGMSEWSPVVRPSLSGWLCAMSQLLGRRLTARCIARDGSTTKCLDNTDPAAALQSCYIHTDVHTEPLDTTVYPALTTSGSIINVTDQLCTCLLCELIGNRGGYNAFEVLLQFTLSDDFCTALAA